MSKWPLANYENLEILNIFPSNESVHHFLGVKVNDKKCGCMINLTIIEKMKLLL